MEPLRTASTLRELAKLLMDLRVELSDRSGHGVFLRKFDGLEIVAYFSDGRQFFVPQSLYLNQVKEAFARATLDNIPEHFPSHSDLQWIADIVAADMEDELNQDDNFDVDFDSSDVNDFVDYGRGEQEEPEEALQIEPENSFVQVEVEPVPEIVPESIIDARERVIAAVVRRRGQPEFRKALIEAYDSACAITGCNAVEALEAAHISPYRGPDTNRPSNGLLLRADLHTLFDLGLIAVDTKTMTVVIAESLIDTTYAEINGQLLRLPAREAFRPNLRALDNHRSESKVD